MLHRSTYNDISFRYEQQEIALNCGTMMRECIRYEALTKILLYSENFYDFFKYVEVSTFDIASDAFATFKVTGTWFYFILLCQNLTFSSIAGTVDKAQDVGSRLPRSQF